MTQERLSPDIYLIDPDPNQHVAREPDASIRALDEAIQKSPEAAEEVIAGAQIGEGASYQPDTPHHNVAVALGNALKQTRDGLALFNLADEGTFDAITTDPSVAERSKERRNNPEDDRLTRQVALAGLRVYVSRLQGAHAVQ